MNAEIIEAVKAAAIDRYTGWLGGIHGLSHWERVYQNGLVLVLARDCGADPLVVQAFAYLHDCCRISDGGDFGHGKRAAEFALSLRGSVLTMTDDQFALLSFACARHADGEVSDNPTVGACWDSYRLDLGRVGAIPDPKFLSTERARNQDVIDEAYARSLSE